MSGIDILRPDNHALYRRVTHLVSLQWKWEAIAEDVGLVHPRAAQDLVEWVLEYREPKKLPTVSASTVRTPTTFPKAKDGTDAERFIAWRKQRRGAQMALAGMRK